MIYLYDDKILIPFNYKEGTKEASLGEISVEFGSDISVPSPPVSKYTVYAVYFSLLSNFYHINCYISHADIGHSIPAKR